MDSDDLAWFNLAAKPALRVIRALAYAVCAALLLRDNTYPVQGYWTILLPIAILGGASRGANIGLLAIAILIIMALFPYPILQMIIGNTPSA